MFKGKQSSKHTKIVVNYNTGMNHNLYIRGNGGGLHWDKGVQLKNHGPDEWIWETDKPFVDCEFKVLIDDNRYEQGENHHIHSGGWLRYSPKF